MRRCHTLWVGFASTLTCLALLLGLFTQVETAQASSTPHITISGVSQLDPTCLTFQITGSGFSAHSNADIVAIEPNTGMNNQPDQVRTSNHGTFSTKETGCVPLNQGSSIQFSVRVRDDHTGKQSNTVHVSYDTSTPTGMPTITVSNLSLETTNCLTFQVTGQGFAHYAYVDLQAQDASWQVNSFQPTRVAADSKGKFMTAVTACSNSTQPTCSTSSSASPCAATPTATNPCPVSGNDFPGFCNQPFTTLFYLIARDEHTLAQTDLYPIADTLLTTGGTPVVPFAATPTPTDQCFVREYQLPGSCQNQAVLFYLTARDEHTKAQSAVYPVTSYGQPILPGYSSTSGAPTLSISNLSQESATCLTFRVMGEGFSHRLHVDLTGQDESQAAVTLTPSRVLTDSNGVFSKKVQACGNFSESAGLGQVSLDWCNILFISDFFCNN